MPGERSRLSRRNVGRTRWLWIGIGLLLVGTGPLVVAVLYSMAHGDPDPNPVGPGICAMFTFWPSIGMIIAGLVGYRRGRADRNDRSAFEWLVPWSGVSPSESAPLEDELRRELADGHAIFGRRARAVARRRDCDDVLFELSDPTRFAVVHLAYSARPDRPPWPDTELFRDLTEFVERRMKPDHVGRTLDGG